MPISWMPSFFTSPRLAHRTADILPPVSAAAMPSPPPAASPLPETDIRSGPRGGIRAALNTFAKTIKAGTDLKSGARTRSYSPFTTRTTSPRQPPSPQMHNSDIPRSRLDADRIPAWPLVEQHAEATRARLMEKIADAAAVQHPEQKRQHKQQSYLDILTTRIPVGPGQQEDPPKEVARNVLEQVLEAVGALPGVAGTKAGAMPNIGMLCVTHAALQACANDPAAAARALCFLRNIDLLASIRHPERMPESVARPDIRCPMTGEKGKDGLFHFNEQDLSLAWKIAQELESTPAGFAALKAMTRSSAAIPGAHPSIGQHDDSMLHAYLQARREQSATAVREGAPPTVLDKAIAQISRRLVASHDHALRSPKTPFAYQARPEEHEWAIGFILNGLYTDEETIDGKPSMYAQIEGRLNKVARWCELAASGNGAASYFLPGYRKSPLNAYKVLEAEQKGDRRGVGLENSARGVIHDARAFKEHILGNLIKGLRSSGGIDGAPLSTQPGSHDPDPAAQTLQNLARLAVLMEVDRNTLPFTVHLHGAAPDAYTIEQARRRIHAWLAQGEDGPLPATRDAVEDALSSAAQPLTLDRLQEWAMALPDGPGKQNLEKPEHSRERKTDGPDWDAYARAVTQVTTGAGEPMHATQLGKPGNAQDRLDAMGDVIENAVAQMELGSRLSFTSGGFVGAGARELTLALSSFLTLTLARPRADASLVRKRAAVLEMETSASGNQIFIGTRRSVKVQGGGGSGVGPAFKFEGVGGFKAGASFDAFVSTEHPETRGVQLRLPRTHSGGMAGDRENNVLLARIFRKHVIGRKSPALKQDRAARAPGADGDSTLKNLLQACPHLGVGLVRNSERQVRWGTSLKGGASVGIGPLSVGPSAGIRFEETRTTTQDWTESKAALNAVKSGHGIKRTVALTGQIHAMRQLCGAVKALAGRKTAPEQDRSKQDAEGLLNAMCVSSVEIGSWGKGRSGTLLIENNAISNGSRATVTHRDAQSFIASVEPKLDRWAAAMVNRFQKDQADAGEAYRQEAYKRAYEALTAQLEDARRNGDAQTRFTELFELTADALEAANALRSAVVLFERSGDREQAHACSAKLDALLASEDAWMPHLLWTQRTSHGEASTGLRFGLYAGKTDAVSSTSIKILG